MEGGLELCAHRLSWSKWKRRHFILTDNVLTYCKQLGGDVTGRLHMKVATLDAMEDDARTFKIFSGVKELKLRAEDEQGKQRWLAALRAAQTAVIAEEANVQAIRRVLQRAQSQQIPDDELKFFVTDDAANALDLQLMQIFELQAIFCSQLSALKATASAEQKRLLGELLGSSTRLKTLISGNTKLLQEERDKLVVVQEIFRRRLSAARPAQRATSLKVTLQEILVEKEQRLPPHAAESRADDSSFFSVVSDSAEIERVRASFSLAEQPAGPPARAEAPAGAHALTQRLLASNAVFLAFPVAETAAQRARMPVARGPAKLDVWSLLKNNIGQDLSRITMPIYLNDPLSMLQKTAEPLEFAEWLRRANRCADAQLRLCYVLAFHYAAYPLSINRLKKPFNPLLGETFELLLADGTRFVAEQVSHHPPVSAFHAESDDFVLEGHICLQATVSLSGFQISASGPLRVTLKAHNERYVYARPKSSLHNFIVGQMYIWHSGEAALVNEATGASALLFFKPKGWGAKHDYECEGKVTDAQGRTAYHLHGKWNAGLTAVSAADKSELQLFAAPAMPPEPESNYHFTQFQLNLNHLPAQLLPRLPPTDSRLRPDQRAYEQGQLELATSEKTRLEEKQRARRAGGEARWAARWFNVADGRGAEGQAQFGGEYFAARESGQWPADLPDLFS